MANGDDSFLARWSRRKAEARGGQRDDAADEPDAADARPDEPRAAAAAPPLVAPPRPSDPKADLAPPDPPGHTPPTSPPASSPVVAATAPGRPAAQAPAAPPAPTLADVASLTRDSDYTRFVAGDVAPEVKNAALKKLFSDPHFNVMDGLDTYIDDYGKPDPLPPGMLRKMVQSQLLGLFTDTPASKEADTPAHPSPEAPVDASADTGPARPDASAGAPPLPDGDADATVPGPSVASAPQEASAHEDPDLQLQPDDAAGRPGDLARAGPDARREC